MTIRPLAYGMLVGFLASAHATGATPTTAVDVVVDMTPAGRGATRPASGKPVYYVPVMGGYQHLGTQVAGEIPPPPLEVAHLVAAELARQGYLVAQPLADNRREFDRRFPVTLVLAIHWGYLNPQVLDIGETDPANQAILNQNQMTALVGGNTLNHLDLDFERAPVMQGIRDDRYFVAITAYDFQAYQKRHQIVQLWQAKMSVPANHVTFDEILPALVKAGGPRFGRESYRPLIEVAPIARTPHVDVGTPTVLGDPNAAPAPAAANAPAGK